MYERNPKDVSTCPPPDTATGMDALREFGYTNDDKLPVTKNRALELLNQGCSVFLLYEGNSSDIAIEPIDIQAHEGMFGIDPDEWKRICKGSQSAQIVEEDLVEDKFFSSKEDCYAIYRLCDCDFTKSSRFQSSSALQKDGIAVDRINFYPIYTDRLNNTAEPIMLAEAVYDRLNMGLPMDFHGYTPSVGDIIAIKCFGTVSYFYVEPIGFTELSHFTEPENYLQNAEMAMEDDFNMIDGIVNNGKKPDIIDLTRRIQNGQSVSVEELAEAARQKREGLQEEPPKQSLLAKLREFQELEKINTVPAKAAERGREQK